MRLVIATLLLGAFLVLPGTLLGADSTNVPVSATAQNNDLNLYGYRILNGGDAYLSRFIDSGNGSFYVDPAGGSVVNGLTASFMYDRDNTGYYVDPAGTTMVNDLRASIMYDRNNTGYYVRPSATSVFNAMYASYIYDTQNSGYYLNANATSRLNSINVNSITLGGVTRNSWPGGDCRICLYGYWDWNGALQDSACTGYMSDGGGDTGTVWTTRGNSGYTRIVLQCR